MQEAPTRIIEGSEGQHDWSTGGGSSTGDAGGTKGATANAADNAGARTRQAIGASGIAPTFNAAGRAGPRTLHRTGSSGTAEPSSAADPMLPPAPHGGPTGKSSGGSGGGTARGFGSGTYPASAGSRRGRPGGIHALSICPPVDETWGEEDWQDFEEDSYMGVGEEEVAPGEEGFAPGAVASMVLEEEEGSSGDSWAWGPGGGSYGDDYDEEGEAGGGAVAAGAHAQSSAAAVLGDVGGGAEVEVDGAVGASLMGMDEGGEVPGPVLSQGGGGAGDEQAGEGAGVGDVE